MPLEWGSNPSLRPLPCVHAPEPETSGYRGYEQEFCLIDFNKNGKVVNNRRLHRNNITHLVEFFAYFIKCASCCQMSPIRRSDLNENRVSLSSNFSLSTPSLGREKALGSKRVIKMIDKKTTVIHNSAVGGSGTKACGCV